MKLKLVLILGAFLLSACNTTVGSLISGSGAKLPEGAYPERIGRFKLDREPDFLQYGKPQEYKAVYNTDDNVHPVEYHVFLCASKEEAKEELKKQLTNNQMGYGGEGKYKISQETDSRFVAVSEGGKKTKVFSILGDKLISVVVPNTPSDASEFEANLPYEAYGATKPAQPATSLEADYIPVLALLDESHKSTQEAIKKYDQKTVLLSGTVDTVVKDKEGDVSIVFKKPDADKYTLDTSTAAIFQRRMEKQVMALKKGQDIKFQCTAQYGLGMLILSFCSLE